MTEHEEAQRVDWSDHDSDMDVQLPEPMAAIPPSDGDSDDMPVIASSSDSDGEMDSDSEGEDAPAAAAARRPAPLPDRFYQVHPIMRLLAGHANLDRQVADSNDALVDHLIRSGAVRTPAVIAAMKVCPRESFVPEVQRNEEAWMDAPLAMQGMGFNMSAPHMHATCLEALQLQPGHRFLDVGSGSGVLTACAAYMVGKAGGSVGIDTRRGAVKFSTARVSALEERSAEYSQAACPCTFQCHNVFIPTPQHAVRSAALVSADPWGAVGQYDRVHVGACCPRNRIPALVSLIKPGGGVIVSPVAPSDLQAITVKPNGELLIQILSQVRYSDLEVPSELAVVMALLKQDRKQRTAVPVPPSTFSDDVAAIHGGGSSSLGSDRSSGSHMSSMDANSRRASESSSPDTPARAPSWPRRLRCRLLSACSSGGIDGVATLEPVDNAVVTPGRRNSDDRPCLRLGELGSADCALVGSCWRIPVHRVVLRARCEQFRALCNSGMRDADATEVHVPEDLLQDAVAAFVHWVYEDDIDKRMDGQSAVGLLRVANFFGAPHLVGLCDTQLSRELDIASSSSDLEGACESAAYLLALADEAGLAHLRAVALDFIVHHYTDVAASPAYAALTKAQTDLVAAEACALLERTRRTLTDVATPSPHRHTSHTAFT